MKRQWMLALVTATALVPAAAFAQDEEGRGRPERSMDAGSRAAARAEISRDSGVSIGAGAGGEFRRGGFQRPEGQAGGWQRRERPQGGDVQRPDRPQGGGFQRPEGQNGWQRPDRPQGGFQRPDRPQGGGFQRPEGQNGWQRPDRPQGGFQRPDGQRPDGWQRPDRPEGGFQRPDRPRGDWQQRPGIGGQRPDGNWQRPGTAAERDRYFNDRRDRFERDRRRDDDRFDRRRDGQWNQPDRRWYGDNGWRVGRDRDGWNDRGGYDRRDWNRDWRRDRRYDWRGYRQSNRNLYRLPRYYAPQGYHGGYRRFGIGFTLSSLLFAPDYWIDDPYNYRLPDAYGPYRWVRYYNDALLVDLETGEVVDVEYDIFW